MEDSASLVEGARAEESADDALRRFRSASRLSPAQQLLVRELAVWREAEARRRNLPRQFVLRDELLFDLAAKRPKTAADLAKLRELRRAAGRALRRELARDARNPAPPKPAAPLLAADLSRGGEAPARGAARSGAEGGRPLGSARRRARQSATARAPGAARRAAGAGRRRFPRLACDRCSPPLGSGPEPAAQARLLDPATFRRRLGQLGDQHDSRQLGPHPTQSVMNMQRHESEKQPEERKQPGGGVGVDPEDAEVENPVQGQAPRARG